MKISEGNSKLGKIPNVNLPPGPENGACRKGVPCSKVCYAKKAWRCYPNVRNLWTGNLDAWIDNPTQFESEVNGYLAYNKPERFRWHSSGDIPSQYYLEMIKRIAIQNPETKFMTYTKHYEYDFTGIEDIDNLVIIISRWPGYKMPDNLKDMPQAHFISKCGLVCSMTEEERKDDRSIPCPGSCKDCSVCWDLDNNESVIFTEH
jgi:hypothetical protein